jgi:hypothetical protein
MPRGVVGGQVTEETREWISQILQDEDLVIRLVERRLLWLEWNPTDKNYRVWMRKPRDGGKFTFAEVGVFTLPIAPSRFGGNIGLTHLPEDLLDTLGRIPAPSPTRDGA